jgi:copper resistance protein B
VIRALLLTGALVAIPAQAQHAGHDMGSMAGTAMPAPKPASKARPKPSPAKRKPAKAPVTAAPDHSQMPGMGHSQHVMPGMDHGSPTAATMPGMDHSQHMMPGMQPTGTALPAGNAPAPTPPHDHYADRLFPRDDMERARTVMMRENGGQTFATLMFNLAEYRVQQGRDGYHWDAEGWFGGDINRLTVKTEGEGSVGRRVDSAEVQALYSRAIGPYFNLQAGVRQDLGAGPRRTYAVAGFEGLAPYWFEVEGAVFLSDKGDVLARLEGYYDQRLTQRLILQPRAELNLSAQDIPAARFGAGLSNAELGLRLRYEIARQFAPYVGVVYEAKTGRTARYARADGDDPTTTSLVAGVRLWF